MKKFLGFPPRKVRMVQIPAQFFSELLPLIDDLAELKVLLFCFWALQQKEGDFRYLRYADFINEESLLRGLTEINPQVPAKDLLDAALGRAIEREALLLASVMLEGAAEHLYFMNTPRGQEAVRQLQTQNGWRPGDTQNPVEILPERPTIYRLYEENIGPLTPLIAEELKDTQETYSQEWIAEAISVAVAMNKRSWRYILGVLEGWQKEGKNREITGGHDEQDGKRYITGKYSDFIKH